MQKAIVDPTKFNPNALLPYELRVEDFRIVMQDVYDFFFDVNTFLLSKGLKRFEDMCRKAILSGFLSEMVAASLGKHSRVLVQNEYPNGHPDLVKQGVYPNNAIQSGEEGVEVKTTNKAGGAVDTHGGRDQWMCVFVYRIDTETQPASDRVPLSFTEIYLGKVGLEDFRNNPRKGPLGTRTSTLNKDGIAKLRQEWVYRAR
jgi:hypothetical protein